VSGPGRGVPGGQPRLIQTAPLTSRERYQLLTSLVVPRPIAWISSRSRHGVPNLAPFSYYMAVAATPMLVAFSIGERRGTLKDSLQNIQQTGEFCINVVTEELLEPMNQSAAEHPPEIDEFTTAGLPMAEASLVAAPYVANCPAVFECRLFRVVELGNAQATLLIGEVLAVRLGAHVRVLPDSQLVDVETLHPVGRLAGDLYSTLGRVIALPRPV
jgi:flavin reductase (DIM6/NTAB) family NADH-FMN oxidoreductase RutF